MTSLTLTSPTARTFVAACVLCLTAVSACFAGDDERHEKEGDIRARAKAMIQKAHQLAERGRVNEAEELERGAHKLLESARQSERKQTGKPGEGEVDKKHVDKKEDKKQTERKPEPEVRKSPESGKTTERKLDPREHKPGQPEHRPHHEIEQPAPRLHHVRVAVDVHVAVENLKSSGHPDHVNPASHRAEFKEHQIRESNEQRERAAREAGRDRRDEMIEDLRREIRQLHEELRTLRGRLEK
jgi:hypothetical protein